MIVDFIIGQFKYFVEIIFIIEIFINLKTVVQFKFIIIVIIINKMIFIIFIVKI